MTAASPFEHVVIPRISPMPSFQEQMSSRTPVDQGRCGGARVGWTGFASASSITTVRCIWGLTIRNQNEAGLACCSSRSDGN